jgi:hypothetical protein
MRTLQTNDWRLIERSFRIVEMKSRKLGTGASGAEVVNVSANGVWLYVNNREYFLPHGDYPWFRNATLGAVLNV